MKLLLATLFLLSSFFAHADYFKLHRNTWIKEEAKSSGALVKSVLEGELLIALDSAKQTNGYYHVQYPKSNFTGYIYRTLVKRISGDFPVFYNTTDAVEITIIDVGPAMSAFIKLPNGKVIVYDAGAYKRTFEYIEKKDPLLEEIEYLILSHTDADHWGSVKSLAENYTLKNVLRTNYRITDRSDALVDGVKAINENVSSSHDFNLSDTLSIPENKFSDGALFYDKEGVKLYFMMGFGKIPEIDAWKNLSPSKKNNGVSIVVKLEYGEHSILFTGDAVGRIDEKEGSIASEKYMLDSLSHELLKSRVLIATHHGAENGSSKAFIQAVEPEYVVFPAGHHGTYKHPRLSTANRFLEGLGLSKEDIFRTDRGDFESGGANNFKKHWNDGTNSDDGDIPGDDHIRIVFPLNGNIQIDYEIQN
jgi:competence protein ComEC